MIREQAATIPRYVISVASRLVGVPPHTLRSYERAGLIQPARTEGQIRLYSDADIEVITRIIELSEQGINLAGIKVILEMEKRAKGKA
ncbi:MAG: MerR family transcriptional regulator [Anaerolineae bacterium]